MMPPTTTSNLHAMPILLDLIKILLKATREESNLKPNLKDNSILKERSSLESSRLRKVKLDNTKNKLINLMPIELKKQQNSNKKLENTKKLLLSSLKLEDSSLITYKVKLSSKSEDKEKLTQRPLSLKKLLSLSKNTSNNTPRELLNSPTEKLTVNSSRLLPLFLQRPVN
jgi:hypothetical protein